MAPPELPSYASSPEIFTITLPRRFPLCNLSIASKKIPKLGRDSANLNVFGPNNQP